MRKRYLALIIAIILIFITVTAVYYLSLPTSIPNILNEPKNQGNESQGNVNPFSLPTNQTTTNKSSGGGGGGGGGEAGGGGTGAGGSTGQPNIPKVYYALNIDSGFGSTDIVTFYYENDTLVNTTRKTPYSIDIEANTEACVAAASAYTGYFWTIDQNNCDMTNCGDYPSGCNITVDGPHNITIHQNS